MILPHLEQLVDIVQRSVSLSEKQREELLTTIASEGPEMATVARRILAFPVTSDLPDGETAPLLSETATPFGMWPPVPSSRASTGARRNLAVLPVDTVLAHRYRIEAYVACGGMGLVYRARDLDLDVPLALKTLGPDVANDPASLRRFKQEVLLSRSVTHPHVCRIFDLGRDEACGITFLTMEYLPGVSLQAYLREHGPLGAEQAMPWVRQLAEALDAAHRAGIVHRDFKSANVMVVPDAEGSRLVITDFGLAVAIERGRPVGTSGAPQGSAETPRLGPIIGTPAYMSPEQVRGGPVGPASDLYALGVVLFEMRTGQLPFPAGTPREAALAHLTMDPPSPRTLASVEDSWDRTILRLLSKKPEDRFATARDVVYALEGRIEGETAVRHLPPEPDVFVGRSEELRGLAEALEGPNGGAGTKLLTLVGAGGTGKTRLAMNYGWASLKRWPGGVWFCDLSESRSRDGIVSAVATALDVPLGGEDPVVQLGHAIAGRGKSLVVLDNFEQVVAHAAQTVGRWLERAAETRFLVTSREPLHLPSEKVLELNPLDPATHGVELFEVRAQAHRPGFAVQSANRAQVEEIVERLEGFPLAIELAAARLRMLSLEQLKERLRDRFQVLSGGMLGRHAALRTTLDWSWELLEPWEQMVLAQLSVFEGGFTLEAAEAVVDLGEYASERCVLEGIHSLVDKSWLRAQVVREAPRFGMYLTVKEYAADCLRTKVVCGDAVEAEARHGRHFARMGTDDAIESLKSHGGVLRLLAMRLETENLVAACRRALAREDAATALATYRAAVEVLQDRGIRTSLELGHAVLASVTDASGRARVLDALGLSKIRLGQMNRACEDYEAALTIYRALGDRGREASSLSALGGLHYRQGRLEAAREHLETALAVFREKGDRAGTGTVAGKLGLLHFDQGQFGEAGKHYEAALVIAREVGDRRLEGDTLGNLGILHQVLGRPEEAREHFEAALAIHLEMGNRRSEGVVLGNLGGAQREETRLKEAHQHLRAALAIHRELGDRHSEGCVLGMLGALYGDQGRDDEAREHIEAALAIHREMRERDLEAGALLNLGSCLEGQGRVADARECYEAALTICRELRNRLGEGRALRNLGLLHHQQGRTEEARACLEAALAIHRSLGDRRDEGIALGRLGCLAAEQGRKEEARGLYDAALSIDRQLSNRIEIGLILAWWSDLESSEGHAEAARTLLAEAESIAADLALGPDSELACHVKRMQGRL